MANGALPAEWEALSHAARVRKAVEVGKQSRTDPDAERMLREWRTEGGFTQRLLAAFAGHGRRDSTELVALASDPSRLISRCALAVLCAIDDDEALLTALRTRPLQRTARMLSQLRRWRPNVVDRFVTARAAEDDPGAWPLVPLGTAAVLDAHFAKAAERGGEIFWRRLAALHPARAAQEVIARLDALTTPDGLLFGYARTVVAVLSGRAPDAALAVVAALRRHVPLAAIPLQTLAERRPVVVADLVLGTSEHVPVYFDRVAHRLGVARIVALARHGAHLLRYTGWLARLAPADRVTIYRELVPGWTAGDGVVAVSVMRVLPTAERVAEARRVAALPALATRPLQRLPVVGLLPWDEARAESKLWLGHPEAENRAAALVALTDAARFDRARLPDLLELLTARKFEQDPVRLAFLRAIAILPPARWKAEHLPALARVIRDALDAADLSSGSVSALSLLVFSVLPFHPLWAAEQLAEITRERGWPGWLGGQFTAEDVRRMAPVLTPVIETWLTRDSEDRITALASSVFFRLPDWPELVALLERIVFGKSRDHTAASALALIAKHVPSARERIIVAALEKDESWILQPPVMNFLHARRQELLTPFLGQRAYSGRFSYAGVRYVLPLATGFERWTDSQQSIFATSLAELAKPPSGKKDVQVTWDVLSAVRRLPALPAIGPERLVKLARDKRQAVQETAVRALGRLDARQGIPELLEALGDARARWAVYALRQSLNDLPPARVLEVMRGVPLTKVTVAKEAVRLAGEFGGGAALAWFTELHARDLHRDVRGALLRALWDHLDRAEAWAIFDASVTSPDPGVVIGLARIQVGRASDEARERVAAMMRRLLDYPEPTVRVAVLGRLAAQPVPDPKRELLAATLSKLASAVPDERTAGLTAALAAATDTDAGAFAEAFTRLLPQRRELVGAVGDFATATAGLGLRLTAVRTAVSAAVEADATVTALHIRLAAARLEAEPFARWVLALVGTDRWHAATQTAALAALTGSAQELERAEAVWVASTDDAARWLALRTLVRAAAEQGWTDARRERLARYGEDASPQVRDEAALTFPPPGEQGTRAGSR